jgi:hypothetical protein
MAFSNYAMPLRSCPRAWGKCIVDLDTRHTLFTDQYSRYDRVVNHIRRQIDTPDREKATRILKWMTLAKRPLKKFELLDGVTLHRGNSQLNEKSRLWEQVIDLCKPLVEDGPNETIVFIHFTVRE